MDYENYELIQESIWQEENARRRDEEAQLLEEQELERIRREKEIQEMEEGLQRQYEEERKMEENMRVWHFNT